MSAVSIVNAISEEQPVKERVSGPGWSAWRKDCLWHWATSGPGGIAGGQACTREKVIEVASKAAHGLGNDLPPGDELAPRRNKRAILSGRIPARL